MSDQSIAFKGFCGAAYSSLSKYAAVDRCVNFFPEVVEDPDETKSRVVLYPTPCTGLYGTLPSAAFQFPSRALLELNGRLFGINGSLVYEFVPPGQLNPAGTFYPIGNVLNDGNPAFMIANGVTVAGNQQIFISSGNRGYILIPSAGRPNAGGGDSTLIPLIPDNGFLGGQGAAFLDDYFVSIIPGTNGIQVSSVNDGTTWSALNVAYTEGQSDTLLNLIADRELLWLFGNRRIEIWYNTGALGFPFSIQPGAFVEIGLGAQASLIQADNSIFFMGQDKRGGVSAWRINGLTPMRISNHAVEQLWSEYPTVTDCVTYAFLWRGHTFVRFIFPSGKRGWTYDCTSSQLLGYAVWHENTFTDNEGNTWAPLERTHAYFQGTHVVGSGGVDGNAGTLFQFTDLTNIPANPYMIVQWSDDGGQTWGAERQVFVGSAGGYTQRALVNLCGSSRDRVFRVKCVDIGDSSQAFPIVRERTCPHIWMNNNRVYYNRFEVELNKGIGREGGAIDGFWALITAELTLEEGVN